jgi:hypothetical protein
MLLCLLLSCRNKDNSIGSKQITEVIDIVNGVFKTQIPYDVNEIRVYVDSWQGHGVYVFFKMPLLYIDKVKCKTNNEWKMIPEEYRAVPVPPDPLFLSDFADKDVELAHLINDARALFLSVKNRQVCTIDSDTIQWYYSKEGISEKAPEQRICMMISEARNGVCNFYLTDSDVRGFGDNEKLYRLFNSNETMVFRK